MKGLVIGRCPKTAEQLSTFCENVRIVLDSSFKRNRKLPELECYQVIYSTTNISRISGVLSRAKEIRKWINEFDLDLIFTNTKWDMVAAKLATLGKKRKVVLLSTSHNSYAWCNHKNVVLMSKLISWTTDIYVALASFVKKQLLEEGIDESKIVLVPNTATFESWSVKDRYDLHSPIKIVYVAYVYPAKKQDFILEVINQLKSKYDIEVDCYGDKDEFVDYVQAMQRKACEYGLGDKFHLCGRIENAALRNLLHQYDIYFCPSLMEMSPVNILEAQAAGLPVLASNVGGIPDLVKNYETGLLFQVDNVTDAVTQLTTLIEKNDLRLKLGLEGRRYVSEVFTKEQAGRLLKDKIDLFLK